jgi:type I restriction enzyme, R subunit
VEPRSEVRAMGTKNLAIEALRKLINGEVRSQARHVTQSKGFTEPLEAAIARYHANALTTAQVLEELIQLANAKAGSPIGANHPRQHKQR